MTGRAISKVTEWTVGRLVVVVLGLLCRRLSVVVVWLLRCAFVLGLIILGRRNWDRCPSGLRSPSGSSGPGAGRTRSKLDGSGLEVVRCWLRRRSSR